MFISEPAKVGFLKENGRQSVEPEILIQGIDRRFPGTSSCSFNAKYLFHLQPLNQEIQESQDIHNFAASILPICTERDELIQIAHKPTQTSQLF